MNAPARKQDAERGGDLLRRHATLCSEIAELIDDRELAREFHDMALEIECWAVEIEAPPHGRPRARD
jgi:hypothetical protein